MKVLLVVVALLVAICAADLSQDEISSILKLHNDARANALPVPQTRLTDLVWDTKIAAYAQSWAGQCKKNFSPKYFGTVYGENYAIQEKLDIQAAFKVWVSQQSSFSFATSACKSANCASYLQIVSSKSVSIGCGVATCQFGSYLVCDYKAYAQFTNVLPYTPANTIQPETPSEIATADPVVGASGYASIDYRGTKAVLGVHDQKQCGSCWAFSATAIIEGACGMAGKTLPLLSDQCVLDCSGGGSCNGGWTVTALKGMVTKGGINSQSAYPYTAAQGNCAYNSATSQCKISSVGQTPANNFASMYNALATYGPVGIAVYADNAWFQYRSGVISSDQTSINHAVTVVGYDSTKNAWIVKNSWGASWGMSGFMYLDAAHPAGALAYGAFWAK